MPVHAPRPHLLAAPMRLRPRRRSDGRANLLLLPLIDMMLVLLLFLLPQMRGDVVCLCGPHPDPPYADHTGPLGDTDRAPLVAIVEGRIALYGYGVVEHGDVTALKEGLAALERQRSLVRADAPRPRSFVLWADRATDFRLLRQVFAACADAGYPNGQLLVSGPFTLL